MVNQLALFEIRLGGLGVVVEFISLRIANKAITTSREVEGYSVVGRLLRERAVVQQE